MRGANSVWGQRREQFQVLIRESVTTDTCITCFPISSSCKWWNTGGFEQKSVLIRACLRMVTQPAVCGASTNVGSRSQSQVESHNNCPDKKHCRPELRGQKQKEGRKGKEQVMSTCMWGTVWSPPIHAIPFNGKERWVCRYNKHWGKERIYSLLRLHINHTALIRSSQSSM